ncbi:Ephrin type-A receptor 4a (Fragment) [Geodia barretti]|uniref:Ephrin type-A receptor 4a n=1 Tax=Geodia barretti TaxID=519541 RepID=A0AA35TYS6_GEOBA
MCYEMAVRRGCRLVGPREVTFSSSEAVTYDRPDGGHKVPYTSHTDTPATTPQRRPHNHYAEECSRTYELTSSYVDPVDNVVNRPLLLPGGPKPNGGVGPNYEEPSCISGSGPGSRQTSRQYSTAYSTVFQTAGTYVPTLEERVFVDGRYETQHSMKHQYNKLCFFPEDKVYWAPATTASGLYAQLSAKRYREIPREQLRLLEQIGSGYFATICKGLWMCEGESMLVAVKKLKENASESDCVRFLQEAATMGQFWHPRVITLHGVVTVGKPSLIVMEYAPNCDILKYLKKIRVCTTRGDRENHAELQKQFLGFAIDIASAMVYLSGKKFVHRDLAARNILLDAHMKCRIADFGLTRHLAENGYYDSGRGQIPVKWTAPEALLYQRHSSASDVWSFGMVLYEMWALGLPPFRNTSNEEIVYIHNRRRGYCLPPPPGTPRAIYNLMVKCWHPEPRQRSMFQQLYQSLSQPEELLLSWSEEEEEVSELARQLGADHAHSQNLYNDLQNKYSHE